MADLIVSELVPKLEIRDDGLQKWIYTWGVVALTPDTARKLIALLKPIAAHAEEREIAQLRGIVRATGTECAKAMNAKLDLEQIAVSLYEACVYMHRLLVDMMGHGGLAGASLGASAIAKAEVLKEKADIR